MDWSVIIAIVLDLLKDCFDDNDPAALTKRLQNPGIPERWAMRRALIEHGIRGKALRDAVKEGMEMLRDDPTLAEDLVAAASEEA